MVTPLHLAFDITSVAISTALPGIAWALLFVVAWRYPSFAESLGLGRRTFWLLLPGALLASFALLPIARVYGDVLAVSVAGAGFPLAVGLLALDRLAPPLRRSAARLIGPLAAETALLLAVVLFSDAGDLRGLVHSSGLGAWGTELALVVLLAAAFTALVVAALGTTGPDGRAIGGILALTSGVLVLTFAGAQAVPGVGIVETFPYFLLPPFLGGVVAAFLARHLFPGKEAFALPMAFLAGSWGVVLGADVLWEPPLYGSGPGGVYAIGGAGVLDLVYLSGFVGLLGAWLSHRLLRRSLAPLGVPLPAAPPSPATQLREAYARGVEGALNPSLAASASAGRAAALQAHRLLGRPSGDPARPWDGLAVPGWVVSDQANLDSVALRGSDEPREALRAYVTARALVALGSAIGRPRFASVTQRLVAFILDLVLLGAAGGGVFLVVVLATPGDLDAVLASTALNAAVYAFVGVALLYFSLAELWYGATLGKKLLGIEVRDRALNRVGGVGAFVRNAPLLPAMTLYSLGLSVGIAVALRGLASSASLPAVGVLAGTLAVLALTLFIVVGIGLLGLIGIGTMVATTDRQRVGDLWAGTWVVRRLSAPAAPPPPPLGAVRYG